ncbi:helix-turn-helix domain-containing protein [Maribellus mangrovi]|uniref:helix-turn-helix domain-containing protein n=1 Tax=Maribellus mangrovi TaxID=3133146 RepID=UPI0030ED7D16
MSLSFSSDSEFIKKLSRVVEENLADENFGVKELAQKTKLSRTQLHRKLKSINNQSVSQFIREIRLNKAKELLQQELGTVSEIAYQVGFGSPSYFIKCFKEYFGYPPGVLLKLPPEDVDNEVSDQYNAGQSLTGKNRLGITLRLLVGMLGVITITVVALFVYKNLIVEKKAAIQDKSIAVLPLKNLSDDTDIQYLAGGIMEDILNRLSRVNDLHLKSRISSEQYRDPDISLPELAEELNVSYVLEGSIINNGDRVRIYVQLIEAESDNHIWSKEYNQDLSDIFEFTSDVSKQIADELQVALTTDEVASIERNYTENTEAYNYYLMGNSLLWPHFWHERTKGDMTACIEYYQKAIEIDSTYGLAYAGLAEAYSALAGIGASWIPYEEAVKRCKEYALKAISLDYNLAEGHAALGDCASDFLFDWDLADKELKLAIQVNPNFALAYRYYADYLMIMGRHKEAKEYLDKSSELDPVFILTNKSYANWYYDMGKFEEVLKIHKQSKRFYNSPKTEQFVIFKVNLHQNKNEEAFEALKQYILLDSPDIDYTEKLSAMYSEFGMKTVIQWFTEYYKLHEADNLQIAALLAYLGEKEKAVDYLVELYNKKDKRWRLKIIKSDYDYRSLHGHQRFTALLEKMDLADR